MKNILFCFRFQRKGFCPLLKIWNSLASKMTKGETLVNETYLEEVKLLRFHYWNCEGIISCFELLSSLNITMNAAS